MKEIKSYRTTPIQPINLVNISQSILGLNFYGLSVVKYFDNFQVTEDFSSNRSATLTSLKLNLQTEFNLKARVNFKKFKIYAKVNCKNSCM